MNEMNHKVGVQTVRSRSYLASLPERTARAGAALAGGFVYEVSEVVLPDAVRRSKLYQAIVGRLLRITIELVGGVEGVYPAEEMPARELLVRKTAGNAVEIASFLAVGWSPVWLLAGASDLVGGSKVYLRALVTELQDAGVLAQEEDVSSFEELLSALEGTSGVLADTVDVPPLNVPRAHLVARTTEADGGSAGRRRSREDLRRAAVGGPARGSFDNGDLFRGCPRRGACGCEAWKRSRL